MPAVETIFKYSSIFRADHKEEALKILLISTILLLIVVLAFAQDRGAVSPIRSIDLPVIQTELRPGEGKEKVESLCAICHSTDYIPMQPRFSKAQWQAIVNKMIKVLGAPIGESDAGLIINYLAMNYGRDQ